MLRGESLPSVYHDGHSVSGFSTVVGGDIDPRIAAGRIKMYTTKFSYSMEVGRAFKRVMQSLDNDNDLPDSFLEHAGKLYRPSRFEVKIVRFPKIYKDLLSMKPRSYSSSSHEYLKKKLAESSHHLDLADIESSKKKRRPSADNGSQKQQKKAKNNTGKIVSVEAPSQPASPAKLPTIFELTSTGTPGKKTKPKAHLLKS